MSNIYHTEPATHGKVLLHTSFGDIDIELWGKECPKACRNFIQHAMEGVSSLASYALSTMMKVMGGLFQEAVLVCAAAVVIHVEQVLSALQQWPFQLTDVSRIPLVTVGVVRHYGMSITQLNLCTKRLGRSR